MQTLMKRRTYPSRRGNLLFGCLAVLGVLFLIVVIATIFVMRSYRGWVAGGVEGAVDAVLVEMQIDEQEQGEIMGHVQTLMTKYTSKEISNEQLARVLENLVESPLVAAAMLGGIDKLYFESSDLNDEEKAAARVQLRRYANGLFDEEISPDTIEVVLASVSTDDPDDNDIVMQYKTGPSGSERYALRSADEVSADDLRELVAQAQAAADEAGIEANPAEIDLSDTLGIAIADALDEDPTLWVPNADQLLEDSGSAEPVEQTPVVDDSTEESPSAEDEP
jgi:hypothetical protein